MIVLVKLFLAHLLGDFILQPNSWVKAKEEKKLRSGELYLHVVLHGFLIMLLLWDINFLLPALIITLCHWSIDVLKILFQKQHSKRSWFAVDQVLHLSVLFAIWYWWQNPSIDIESINTNGILIFTAAIVFLTNPSSVIIRTLISQWTPSTVKMEAESLPDAGKFIGILERLFVLVFIITNHWEAVGFLLTAKSYFGLVT